MRLDWREFTNWREFVATGGYVLLVPISFQFDEPDTHALILVTLILLAFLAFMLSLHRLRAIRDTPTSRVATAAQGYVELVGKGRVLPDLPVYSPGHHLPCLWYRYRAYVRSDDKWHQTESDHSISPFLLDDGSGLCLVDPDRAEVATSRKETYVMGDSKLEEELLLDGDNLYVLGDFISRGGGRERFDEHAEVGNILAEWKEDQDALLQRFDLDGNGEIDMKEWQLARLAARREMESRKADAMRSPVTHRLGRPRFGRPFLIANYAPGPLVKRYRLRVWVHGAVTFAALIWLAYSLAGA